MPDDKTPHAPPPAPSQPISMSIDEAEGQGIYSNLALISHSSSEVILDFARAMPGLPKAKIHARIIMTPQNAKSLHRALGENLSRYETQFGPIQKGATEDPSKSIGFRT